MRSGKSRRRERGRRLSIDALSLLCNRRLLQYAADAEGLCVIVDAMHSFPNTLVAEELSCIYRSVAGRSCSILNLLIFQTITESKSSLPTPTQPRYQKSTKMPEYQGRCHCGQTEWTANLSQESHVLCHCGACKLMSGGEFTTNQIIPKENFKLTKGKLSTYTYKGDSGKSVNVCRTRPLRKS